MCLWANKPLHHAFENSRFARSPKGPELQPTEVGCTFQYLAKSGLYEKQEHRQMVFTARQLQEKHKEQHQNLFMTSVDLFKAFDTVQKDLLWEIVLRCGCPNKSVSIFQQFYESVNAQMTIGGQECASFPVCTGIRQSCILAPLCSLSYSSHASPSFFTRKLCTGCQFPTGWMATCLISVNSKQLPSCTV